MPKDEGRKRSRKAGCSPLAFLLLASVALAGLKAGHVQPVADWPWLWVAAPMLLGLTVRVVVGVVTFVLRVLLVLALVALVAWLAMGSPAIPMPVTAPWFHLP